MAQPKSNPFSRSTLIGLIIFTVTALAFYVYVQWTFDLESTTGNPKKNADSSWASEPLGRKALHDLLKDLGIPVMRSTSWQTKDEQFPQFLIVDAPTEDEFSSVTSLGYGSTQAILYVLPKRDVAKPSGPLLDVERVQDRLQILQNDAQVSRPNALTDVAVSTRIQATVNTDAVEDAWFSSQSWNVALPQPQLIEDQSITPIVWAGDQVLVGEVQSNSPRTWVIADPDSLTNHGLDDGDNARFVVAVIDALRRMTNSSSSPVAFVDRWGTNSKSDNILQLLFEFPYVLISITFMLLFLVLGWVALSRFGGVIDAAPSLHAGRRQLVHSATQLLQGHDDQLFMLNAYAEDAQREVALHYGVTITESMGVKDDVFTPLEQSRKTHDSMADLTDLVANLRRKKMLKNKDIVQVAQRIRKWKMEMLHES